MEKMIITTDGTCEGTTLNIDGVDVTSTECVVGLNMYVCAPFKMEDWSSDGCCRVEYSTSNAEGKIETHSFDETCREFKMGMGQSEDDMSGEGMMDKLKSGKVLKDNVNGYVGKANPTKESIELVDKIIKTATEKKTFCPSREKLLTRTVDSLKDKLADLVG